MIEYLLLIYPIALLAVYLYGCNVATRNSFTEDCLSREQSKMLQAVSCLFVVLHHLSQMITSYGDIYRGPITILSSMGILFTSVFFFFSGYGLIISVKSNEKYLDNFLRHRLSTILVPFFIANIIAVLIRTYYVKIKMTPSQIVKCVTGYILINGNGWYIVEIFFIYIAFYLLFKTIKNKKIATILLCCFVISLIYIGYVSGHDFSSIGDHWFKGEWWYNSTIVFVYGVIVACYKEQIFTFVKKHYRNILIIFSVLFVVCFYIEEIIRKRYGYYTETIVINRINSRLITLLSQMILCVVFTSLVILIHMKIKTGNKAVNYVSKISMEIFLIHGLFINYIPNLKRINEFISFAIVIICGIIAAAVVNVLDSQIIRLINCRSIKKDYIKDCGINLIRDRKERTKKRIYIITASVFACVIVSYAVYSKAILRSEYKREIDALRTASVNESVFFGRYEIKPEIPFNERVEWLVLKKDSDKIMLISKQGIESSVYNKKHEEVSYIDSDIYELLNSYIFDNIFSEYEKESVIVSPNDDGSLLSLLSVEEAELLFDDELSRQLLATPYAIKKGVNVNTPSKINSWDYKDYRTSWWWLKGEKGITAPIVSAEGTIETNDKYVNKPNGAIRPVVWVKIN